MLTTELSDAKENELTYVRLRKTRAISSRERVKYFEHVAAMRAVAAFCLTCEMYSYLSESNIHTLT